MTIGAFTVGLYGAGGILLPLWVKSDADRWVIAAGLGVALAALAALWGINFAQGGHSEVTGGEAGPYLVPKRIIAKASGRAKIYQSGRDQNFRGR
jgi:hypothetical protein